MGVLGEGGMGIVYLAEQREPIRRRVALKVLKHGDAGSSVARFESESQALALMDHPNIACVYDAGTTPNGRPYFVMEYVSGIPITDYCDRNLLGCRDRLALIQQVCQAVHHAHQKGVAVSFPSRWRRRQTSPSVHRSRPIHSKMFRTTRACSGIGSNLA
jgi:non-specific serine/threonine protein kinase/serine/threonine-protein kinase